MQFDYDVVLYDDIGTHVDDRVVATSAIGGSELVLWQLATELARQGARVALWQGRHEAPDKVESGVTYLYGTARPGQFSTRLFVHHRYSSGAFAQHVVAARYVGLATDRYTDAYHQGVIGSMGTQGSTIVAVSAFQRSEMPPEFDVQVIPNPVPDAAYTEPTTEHDPHRFVYASAALKGLDATLQAWSRLKVSGRYPEARLDVLSPGYDDGSQASGAGVTYVGPVPTAEVIERLRASAGLFYVNTFPETFCLVAAYAEAVGARLHCLVRNGGALADTVSSHLVAVDDDTFDLEFVRSYGAPRGAGIEAPHPDYRLSLIARQWLALIP